MDTRTGSGEAAVFVVPRPALSVIIPVHNESGNLPVLYEALVRMADGLPESCEFIFVNDASTDGSDAALRLLRDQDSRVQVLELSRNFGKEIALTAGLHAAAGEAAIMLDADLQHPVELIPEFVAKWRAGAEVVVGIRRRYRREPYLKRLNSWLFYLMLNSIAETKVTPHATDFRLLDRIVIDEFNRLSERNRITRGLIDWLGFRREFIYFEIHQRHQGRPSYGFVKLFRLALNSFVSLSLVPLRLAGYLGIIITLMAGSFGLFTLIERHLLKDPLGLHISGTAELADINMLLIGIVLMSLGLIALYIANIHAEVINRPLYVLRRSRAPRPAARAKKPTAAGK